MRRYRVTSWAMPEGEVMELGHSLPLKLAERERDLQVALHLRASESNDVRFLSKPQGSPVKAALLLTEGRVVGKVLVTVQTS